MNTAMLAHFGVARSDAEELGNTLDYELDYDKIIAKNPRIETLIVEVAEHTSGYPKEHIWAQQKDEIPASAEPDYIGQLQAAYDFATTIVFAIAFGAASEKLLKEVDYES